MSALLHVTAYVLLHNLLNLLLQIANKMGLQKPNCKKKNQPSLRNVTKRIVTLKCCCNGYFPPDANYMFSYSSQTFSQCCMLNYILRHFFEQFS
jgi:hypothetical protein